MNKLKIIFMGTPDFAVPVLEGLIENYEVILVVCQPDREKDRKGNLLPSPIKKLAESYNIEIFQPEKIRKEYDKIVSLNPDMIVTCAYGQIIPEVILNTPKYGCINVHGSLLPKYRGGAPIHHAIMNGEKETGITIMYMDKGMDSGDIIKQESIKIEESDNLDSIYSKMSKLGADLLIRTIPNIIDGSNDRIKQDESKVTFGYNVTKEDEKLDFNMDAVTFNNRVRGLSSIPGAYCYMDNLRLKIYGCIITNRKSTGEVGKIVDIDKNYIYINTKDYVIGLSDIKLEGKKRCLVKDYLNGIKKEDLVGKILN